MEDRRVVDLLRRLTEPIGVPGMEDEVRRVLVGLVEPLADDVRVDALGNLIATRRGRSPFRLMLDAHMDEVGFVVSYIDDQGFLRLAPLGGWDARIIPSHLVTVVADDGRRVPGVIGTTPPHILDPEDSKKPHRLEDLFVDVGARSAAEVEALGVRIGSPAVIAYPFVELDGRRVAARALDDRAGCAALVLLLQRLAESGQAPPVTVVVNFAVAEEVGMRGAQVAAYQIEPDLALAVETTVAADVPGVPSQRQPTRMGAGPALTVVDRSLVADRQVVSALTAAASDAGIPFQYKLPSFGGTDAGAIQRSRAGVPAGVVSIPARYIHAPYGVLDLEDLHRAVDLLEAFVSRCPPEGLGTGRPQVRMEARAADGAQDGAQRAAQDAAESRAAGGRRARATRRLRPGTKSELFRQLYDQGKSVVEIARETNSPYSFVYGVIKRYRARRGET